MGKLLAVMIVSLALLTAVAVGLGEHWPHTAAYYRAR